MLYYNSMTFVGFNFKPQERHVDLLDLQDKIIVPNIMSDSLYDWMKQSGVETRQDPDKWSK